MGDGEGGKYGDQGKKDEDSIINKIIDKKDKGVKIIHSELLKPNRQKVILLIGFLLFFPSPVLLIFVVAFVPAFFTLHITAGIVVSMTNYLLQILGFLIGLSYFFILAILNYLIVCLLEKRFKKKIILWAILGGIIFLTSYFNLYWIGTAGGKSNSSNAIEFYKNILLPSGL